MSDDTAQELLHQLYTALPFVEDAERDSAYKPGVVRRRLADMRAVIAKAEKEMCHARADDQDGAGQRRVR